MSDYNSLEKNSWYWISSREDGDVFYPVLVKDNGFIQIDDLDRPPEYFKDVIFDKCDMPTRY